MEKLKSRLDAFSDAIIAIIITIMVLNIPPVLHDSVSNYLELGKSVGIFLISFIFVANIWYQHGTAFAEIETMTYRIMILDLSFLAVLSLMPLFTNMMAENTTRYTVLLYGLLQLVVNFLFRILAKAIIHLEYTDTDEMRKVYTKIYGSTNHILDSLSFLALVAAVFIPHLALVFYLAYPLAMFYLNSDSREQMYDVATLPKEQQKDFVNLDAEGMKDFRKAQRQFWSDQTKTGADGKDTKPVAKDQGTEAKPAEKLPADAQSQPTATTWKNWLDQNVDPQRRAQFKERFDDATPEQQAKMEKWFEQRKQRMNQRQAHIDRKQKAVARREAAAAQKQTARKEVSVQAADEKETQQTEQKAEQPEIITQTDPSKNAKQADQQTNQKTSVKK